jgi:predicted ATPase
MLESVTISNFKSFREATLKLSALTLLIGANASGKSNALEALQVLSWMATGRRLGDILFAIKQGELAVRGTIGNLTYSGLEDKEIRFKIVERSESRSRLTLDLALRVDADLSIQKEWARQCELHPLRRVYIGSLDAHLSSYDRESGIPF